MDKISLTSTTILVVIEGQFQVSQRFSSSKLVPKAVESCFVTPDYYENGSTAVLLVIEGSQEAFNGF